MGREVLECGSPLPLSIARRRSKSGRGLPHSKTLARSWDADQVEPLRVVRRLQIIVSHGDAGEGAGVQQTPVRQRCERDVRAGADFVGDVARAEEVYADVAAGEQCDG